MATTKRTRAAAAAARQAESKERAAELTNARRATQVAAQQKRKEKRSAEQKKKAEAEEKKRASPASKAKASPATKGKAKRKLTPVQMAALEKGKAASEKGKKMTSPATKKKATTKKKTKKKPLPQKKLTCAAEMAGMKNNHVRLAQQKAQRDADAAWILEAERHLEESESKSKDEEQSESKNFKPVEPIDPAIQQLIHETEKHHLSDNCRRNHRHRIKRMTEFWKQSDNVPNSCVQKVVRVVPPDECNNASNWFCANRPWVGPFKEDLHCGNMSSDCHKAFLGEVKIKDDGDCRSADDMRKFRDAIMWGAKTAKQFTPSMFCGDIKTFHKACREKHTNAGKKGDAQDTAADPVTLALDKKLLEWSLDWNDICA